LCDLEEQAKTAKVQGLIFERKKRTEEVIQQDNSGATVSKEPLHVAFG
jgi:hypothetical protein